MRPLLWGGPCSGPDQGRGRFSVYRRVFRRGLERGRAMNWKDMVQKIHSLVVFRSIWDDEVFQKFAAMLQAVGDGAEKAVDTYAAFVAALYQRGDNWSEYLLHYILCDENFYMLLRAEGKQAAPVVEQAVQHELRVLDEIAQVTSESVQRDIRFSGFLPQWNTKPLHFGSVYRDRLANIEIHGYGIFAQYRAFVLKGEEIVPIQSPDPIRLSEMSGYEAQRAQVIDNTKALLMGRPASNILLYGDAGTGKSSTVKAVVNEFAGKGLRMIELKKKQLYQLPMLLDLLSKNPLKFILFIDDLSFDRDDGDFAALKAILEGSASGRPQNLVVYATSNRRHLVRETASARAGDEIHLSDTIQEQMSLSDRFGILITFLRPEKDVYLEIVLHLAEQYGVTMDRDELIQKAEAHALRRNGRSPRTARQFIEQCAALQGVGKR